MSLQKSCKPHSRNAGNWYSWSASTAGSGTTSSTAKRSICPKNWQLDIDSATKSFAYLFRSTYSISGSDYKIRLLPFSYNRSGYYDYNTIGSREESARYWTGVAYNSTSAYYFSYSNTNFTLKDGMSKGWGHSVRCVAR